MTCNVNSSGTLTRALAASRDRQTFLMVSQALAAGRTMLAFQPVVEARNPTSPAFHEGLIRILDETGIVVPAGQFVAAIEDQHLGRAIDCAALTHGLDALARVPDLRLSLNMSVRTIGHRPWMRVLDEGLERDPMAAERLIIEITERSAILAPEKVGAFMKDLQAHGIAFALDDFGSGYTSFRHFRELRFDILKLDGSYCRGIDGHGDNRFLVETLVRVGRHFGCYTVAEMVERPEDAAVLAELGLDALQGWLFGKPELIPHWHRDARTGLLEAV
ncbi:EAL domain-containing protein [Roseitranquillus sediminis]|uniref:EAL domain-containing protein n=1 Tax=Roseitranquillus sediminis TaxID=2809051 RepID=UPI001D0C12BB|nr:EAL domain-containing protein [Roseitranquillus sediminis]MBM9593313.1 EAL domain-containing protein [Roseitranquillus sediminis]